MDDLLEPLRSRPDRAAIVTDFDGTLSPIVEDWTAAAPLRGAREVLDALVDRYALVAVVSGRPVGYLATHLGTRVRLSGLYGLESIIDGTRVTVAGAEEWRAPIAGAVTSAEAHFGTLVEDKGLSVTVHFRTRPEVADEVRAWAERESRRTGLVLRDAKASVELHPPIAVDKGSVVEAAVGDLDAVVFFGDDRGDLPAFLALDRLRARGVHAVKVGVQTAEAPAALIEVADVVVQGPVGALELLRTL